MKLRAIIAILVCSYSVHAQGTFQDLDFESANLSNPSGPFNEVPISAAIPGWSGSIGGTPVTTVWANNYSLGDAMIDVFGPGESLPPGIIDPGIVGGNYSVFLQAFNTAQGNVSISQSGTIPASAESLQFSAWFSPSLNQNLAVSFAGNSLSPVPIGSGQTSSGQTYTIFRVNIAPYAAQTGQLEFTAAGGQGPDWVELDDITFSTTSVPEPSPLILTGLASVLFALKRAFHFVAIDDCPPF